MNRAKRYERMLKTHGINPQGGPLDNPPPTRERNVTTTPKPSKKRKADDVSGFIKHHEDEEKKPHHLKRSRADNHRQTEAHQGTPLIDYLHPPYVGYHPMMGTPGPPFISRPLPPSNMHPSMQYGGMPPPMQNISHQSHASHPMFPGPNSNHHFMMPLQHQMQPFNMSLNIPSSNKDNRSSNVLDEIAGYDFGDNGFESFLYGNPATSQNRVEQYRPETILQPQMLTTSTLQPELHGQVKIEPHQAPPSTFIEPKLLSEVTSSPPPIQLDTKSDPVSLVTDDTITDVLTAPDTRARVEDITEDMEKPAPLLKQEIEEGCILISD